MSQSKIKPQKITNTQLSYLNELIKAAPPLKVSLLGLNRRKNVSITQLSFGAARRMIRGLES